MKNERMVEKSMQEDQEAARKTLEGITTLIRHAEKLLSLGTLGDYLAFEQAAADMSQTLQEFISTHEAASPSTRTGSIADSLSRIMVHAKARSHKTLPKIEFELLPLLKEFYHLHYFFSCVYPDRALMQRYFEHEMIPLGENKYIDAAVRTGIYKYDLTIAVLAYNKLEYTKLCVESILKYTPQNLNYELILVNHGSTDGTKEYFESIAPTKQIDISINGGGFGAYTRYLEGKYFLLVSNDVVVTENAIANMLRCIESDEKIAWVVPTTPNVSNLQSIPAEYRTIDEMHAFAGKNNERSDPYRWEQRARLCDPISLCRSSVAYSYSGVHWSYYMHTDLNGTHGFMDDKQSLFYRRNGYKMMLAKDSYCHHFGSVTLGEEIGPQETFYQAGRKAFYDVFCIDPWGAGFCWSPELMTLLPYREQGHVNILGVNCGIGSNPLKIKETLKENAHNLDVTLYNVTDDLRYAEDLRGISDVFACEQNGDNFYRVFPGVTFNYIVFESGFETCQDPLGSVKAFEERLTTGGLLILQTGDQDLKKNIRRNYPTATITTTWCIIPAIDESYDQYPEDWMIDGELQLKKVLEWGEERFAQGDVSAAKKIFERVLRIDKTNSQALNNLGVIQWQVGDMDSAIEIFQTALSFNHEDPDALANLLQAATETGRFDLIKQDLLDTLIKDHPENPDLITLINARKDFGRTN
jgi:O-antigen biosynthesis protein